MDRVSNDCLKSVPLGQVSFVSVDKTDPCIFSFFSNDMSSRLITAHCLRLATDKQSEMILLAVNESFKINNGQVVVKGGNIKRHMSTAGSKKGLKRSTSATNSGRELGRFETAWLGMKCLGKPLSQVCVCVSGGYYSFRVFSSSFAKFLT